MDNASVHRIDDAMIKRLKATQITFSPAKTTSQLQPMDTGIIPVVQLKDLDEPVVQAAPQLPHHAQGESRHHVQSPEGRHHRLGHRVGSCLVQVNPRTISKCFAKCGFKGADDTGTAAVTADLPLPQLAAGDTEELAMSATEMEDDNIFPPIAKAEELLIEASAAIDAEAQRIAGQGLMIKAGLDAEEHESDDEAQIPIPLPMPSWRL